MIVKESILRDILRLFIWFPYRWFIYIIPVKTALSFFKLMGLIHFLVNRSKKKLLKENIPESIQSKFSLNRIILKYMQTHYLDRMCVFLFPKLNAKRIQSIVRIDGLEHIDKALEKQKGVILIHSHFGPAQFSLFALAHQGYKMNQLGLRSDENISKIGKLQLKIRLLRSAELDQIGNIVDEKMKSYANGLTETAVQLRLKQKDRILEKLGADETDWDNWKWHLKNVISDADSVRHLMEIDDKQHALIMRARKERLPFGITPYYLSLMEEGGGVNDQAIRAQVFPPEDYVNHMIDHRKFGRRSFDFMLESDTSPVDLITRRYPNIVILKPVKTCPQICVYCQRNWEIEQVLAPNSVARENEIEMAVEWIRKHPAIKEVLVTGGDPFILPDTKLESLLSRLCEIDHIDCIRIGSRVLVTLPMRITDKLAEILGRFRVPGRREIAVVTHIEHPYEITPDTVRAVDKLKRQGISVYNQQVYTFYTSRRFESTFLRMLLRRAGIDPYYTFMPKGKEETNAYRVPLARILQEQKEEARLVPGLRRTDDAVFNIPGLGKNYLLARQHRDLLTILPNGSRLYEFHPWDMNLVSCDTYLYEDVTILDYLKRLAESGEDPKEYDSIWFFL